MRSFRFAGRRTRLWGILAACAVVIAVAVPTLAGAGHEAGSVASFTGCLSPPAKGGSVYHVKVGDTPSGPCKPGHAQIHISGGDITEANAGDGLTGGAANGSATLSLADGGVTSAKLADSSVDSDAVSDGSLGTAEFSTSIPAVRVTHSGAQSAGSGLGEHVTLAFDSERYDTASMHDTSGNSSRLTAPVSGIYAITASVTWTGNPGGVRTIALVRNGVEFIGSDARPAVLGGEQTAASIATLARLAAGDYVEVSIRQNSGVSLDITKGGEHSPEFAMTWLTPGP